MLFTNSKCHTESYNTPVKLMAGNLWCHLLSVSLWFWQLMSLVVTCWGKTRDWEQSSDDHALSETCQAPQWLLKRERTSVRGSGTLEEQWSVFGRDSWMQWCRCYGPSHCMNGIPLWGKHTYIPHWTFLPWRDVDRRLWPPHTSVCSEAGVSAVYVHWCSGCGSTL